MSGSENPFSGKIPVRYDGDFLFCYRRLFPDLVGDLLIGMRSICPAGYLNIAGFKPPAQLQIRCAGCIYFALLLMLSVLQTSMGGRHLRLWPRVITRSPIKSGKSRGRIPPGAPRVSLCRLIQMLRKPHYTPGNNPNLLLRLFPVPLFNRFTNSRNGFYPISCIKARCI